MVTIRRVGRDELDVARRLHNQFTAQDRSSETVRGWYEAVPSLFLFAIEAPDSAPVGVATGRPGSDGSASLAGLGLTPDRRGEGIGSRLLERFEANALDAEFDRISVASAGGYVDEFYADCGYGPICILVMAPDGAPGDYRDTAFDVRWDRNEYGSRKLYVESDESGGFGDRPDQNRLEAVREAFGDDEAIYIMAKHLTAE
jgi:GNAT superfamily N-acetyltransferase